MPRRNRLAPALALIRALFTSRYFKCGIRLTYYECCSFSKDSQQKTVKAARGARESAILLPPSLALGYEPASFCKELVREGTPINSTKLSALSVLVRGL